ncbi:MAG: 50S ribosomal protein L22 [bacterium]
MEAKAKAKYMRISPRKARQVTTLIQGKPVEQATNMLKFTTKKACRIVQKILHSAIANARQKGINVQVGNLYVKNAFVDQGPTLKRIQPRAMGRAYRICKRTSHITIVVDEY